MKIQANLVDIHQRRIYPAALEIVSGTIHSIEELQALPGNSIFILPGFVDAHVHVESSMLPPTEFARLAVAHGTVGTVSDPHEIANVLGVAGVEYMLNDATRTPFKFCFGAPSCVPATGFETAGAVIDANDVERLLRRDDIGYLSEMMNFPGVLFNDPGVMAKIDAAKRLGKPVDGHAPALRGDDARRYFAAGITTDHECFTLEEAVEKASLGVKILIREGSAARNFEALWPLINQFPELVMFCSDDKHPDDLIRGHINLLVQRALALGCDLFDVLRAACLHPVEHYRLPIGLLREGDPADFILVNSLEEMTVMSTWLDGRKVAENGQSLLPRLAVDTPNQFAAQPKIREQFEIAAPIAAAINNDTVFPSLMGPQMTQAQVIVAWDGQIVTGQKIVGLHSGNGLLHPSPSDDILLIAVVNRYTPDAQPALGFITGFGLREGAIASSIAHDSHNIVAVGVNAACVCMAVNKVIEMQGGIAAVADDNTTMGIALPIAGLMSNKDGYELAEEYQLLDHWVKDQLSCTVAAPFMLLSFMALPVIPALKMTDLGLFDVNKFEFTPVIV